ncbi:MAG TPA: 2Fe-2S iron-sulfur cluster-binding protein, partial [bacterium]|nr:2Fe-2S iron-sulfur cluster-binding protein [bacterium]
MPDASSPFITLTFLPAGRRTTVPAGTSILDAAQALGLAITSLCGGAGLCGQCRILLRRGTLPVTHNDLENLTPEELKEGYRLSCSALP